MKTVLCGNDLKREVLCRECQRRLDAGEISDLDVKVSKLLYRMSKKFFEPDIEFRKALDLDEIIVLACTGDIGLLIGRGGKIVGEMSRELGKKVRIIEKNSDEKKMAQDLAGAARILGVNKVFRKDGEELKIMLAEADRGRLFTTPENLEKAMRILLNAKVTTEFV